jgi:hypothetical protein
MDLIDRLSPEQQKKFKEKQAKSRIEQANRRWAYHKNYGVLCETKEQYEEIKEVYDQDRPDDNKSLVIRKFGQAKQDINRAKKQLESKKKPAKKEEKEQK